MIRKFVAFILAFMLFHAGSGLGFASGYVDKDTVQAEKVKKAIIKLGTGVTAIVSIKLRDKSKVEGFVSEINDDYFVVMNNATGTPTKVAYPNVKQIRGNNMSTKTKIAIGVGIAIGILVIIAAVKGNIGGKSPTLEDAFKKNPLP